MTLLMPALTDPWVDEWPRDMQALELALLRRGVRHRISTHERCRRCGRTPLPGERVYLADDERVVCALCRTAAGAGRHESRIVRGPSAGRAIRVLASRAA
jgi:hypothetical protein